MHEQWQKQILTGKILLGILAISWLWYFATTVSDYYKVSDSLDAQKLEFTNLQKQIALATEGMTLEAFLNDKAGVLASYYGKTRFSYPPSELLNHLAILGENTYLTDVIPRIKRTKRLASHIETTVYVNLKGKFHQISKFVNLLESSMMAYPVSVKKVSLRRAAKNPSGDLEAYLEVVFFSLKEDLALMVTGKGQPKEQEDGSYNPQESGSELNQNSKAEINGSNAGNSAADNELKDENLEEDGQ